MNIFIKKKTRKITLKKMNIKLHAYNKNAESALQNIRKDKILMINGTAESKRESK